MRSTVFSVLAVAAGALGCQPRPAPPVEVTHAADVVTVSGLGDGVVEGLRAAGESAQREALRVYVVTDALEPSETPPIHGTWQLTDASLVFRPAFPFAAGTSYRAQYSIGRGRPSVHEWTVPARPPGPAPRVERVEPTATQVPANLLRLYIHLSSPMRPGAAYDHLALFDLTAGARVPQPFVEIEQELWGPDRQRLTLLFDPGRIKRAVGPNVERGPVLEPGHRYELRVEPGWRDVRGRAVESGPIARFEVGPPDRARPAPATWDVAVPSANTREPLRVAFGEPLDAALARRALTILGPGPGPGLGPGVGPGAGGAGAGRVVAGRIELLDAGVRWELTPDHAWKPGTYRVEVAPILEDLAGNTPDRLFDTDLQQRVEPLPRHRSFSIDPAP